MVKREHAFTLIELLVVITIIGILASLILPSLAKSKQQAQGMKCISNLKQLTTAWIAYAGDAADLLVTNTAGNNVTGETTNSWASGWEDWADPTNPDNTNINTLMSPLGILWPYSRSLQIYQCPSDPSIINRNGGTQPLIRSVSMNLRMNGSDWPDAPIAEYNNPNRLSAIINPAPANAFVFLDERIDSINDGYFVVEMDETNQNAVIGNVPANYHNGCCSISFADGHCETHHWQDPRTEPPLNPYSMQDGWSAPNDVDIAWIQQHCSALIK